MRAFSESNELYLEIEQIGDPNFVVPIIREHGIDRDVDLSDRLPPGCREQLAPAIQEYGFDTNSMARLRPWVATLTLGQAPLVRAGYDLSLGVDVQLKSAAAERGMPVHGLETAESQVLSMATLSDNMQIALLCSLLDGLPTVSAQLDRIRRSWLAGDLSALDTHVNETTRQEYPEFYEAFIVVRNRGMAERMQDRMAEPGRVFVAVGAAHLVGSDSVQRFLSGAGVEVERVH